MPVTAQTPRRRRAARDRGAVPRARRAVPRAARCRRRRSELSGALGRFEDSALVDAIQEVQLHYAKATSASPRCSSRRSRVPAGPGDRARAGRASTCTTTSSTPWKATADAARRARERRPLLPVLPGAACASAARSSTARCAGYNFDMAQGVAYELDLTQPAGQPREEPALQGRAAARRAAAADRGQQLPRGRLRRLRDVPRREGRLAQRPRNPRPDGRVLHASGKTLPRSPTATGGSCPPRAVETLAQEEASPR